MVLKDDGSLKVKVYRKPTHTDQYLNWGSNHHLDHKRSVVRTLLRRAEVLVTDPEDQETEKQHVKKVLQANGYKPWVFKTVKTNRPKPTDSNNTQETNRKIPVCLPYVPGTSEKLHRLFKAHGVPAYHKPFNTIRSLLVNPKDKPQKEKQCGVVYSMKCVQCGKLYIGETARSLGARFKEHTDGKHPSSAVTEHMSATGHWFTMDSTKVVSKEEQTFKRKIKEAMTIHQQKPELNRDRGLEIPAVLLSLLSHDTSPSHVTQPSVTNNA